MALKDLVADHRKIAEETIEKIITSYVRYDPAAQKIAWTPEGRVLGNDARILVFLVAVLGWQYVVDNAPEVPTKPANLEAELGIAGGTLRPILKKLKDAHLLVEADGHYRVQLANVNAIEAAIAGNAPKAARKSSERRSAAQMTDQDSEDVSAVKTGDRKSRGAANPLKTLLKKWVADGFFKDVKTLSDLHDRYHEQAIIVKQTSLSGLLLDAVREGLLTRSKTTVGGKVVWAYSATNN